MEELGERAAAEVRALHRFFEDWFAGRLPDTDRAFARLSDSLDPAFEIVTPRGEALGRRALLDALRAAHGQDGRRIAVELLGVRRLGPLALVRYHEWQRRPPAASPAEAGAWTGRRSAALLQEDARAPTGWRWLYVHETWLPEGTAGGPSGPAAEDAERPAG